MGGGEGGEPVSERVHTQRDQWEPLPHDAQPEDVHVRRGGHGTEATERILLCTELWRDESAAALEVGIEGGEERRLLRHLLDARQPEHPEAEQRLDGGSPARADPLGALDDGLVLGWRRLGWRGGERVRWRRVRQVRRPSARDEQQQRSHRSPRV